MLSTTYDPLSYQIGPEDLRQEYLSEETNDSDDTDSIPPLENLALPADQLQDIAGPLPPLPDRYVHYEPDPDLIDYFSSDGHDTDDGDSTAPLH